MNDHMYIHMNAVMELLNLDCQSSIHSPPTSTLDSPPFFLRSPTLSNLNSPASTFLPPSLVKC